MIQRIDKLKVKEWIKVYSENTNQKKTGVAILMSDKLDLRTNKTTRNKRPYALLKCQFTNKTANPKHVCT